MRFLETKDKHTRVFGIIKKNHFKVDLLKRSYPEHVVRLTLLASWAHVNRESVVDATACSFSSEVEGPSPVVAAS